MALEPVRRLLQNYLDIFNKAMICKLYMTAHRPSRRCSHNLLQCSVTPSIKSTLMDSSMDLCKHSKASEGRLPYLI